VTKRWRIQPAARACAPGGMAATRRSVRRVLQRSEMTLVHVASPVCCQVIPEAQPCRCCGPAVPGNALPAAAGSAILAHRPRSTRVASAPGSRSSVISRTAPLTAASGTSIQTRKSPSPNSCCTPALLCVKSWSS